eukprot:scaffold24298_cov56-Phaeocystis_antarctica.AAC.3
MYAASEGWDDCVPLLLKAGADHRMETNKGRTALQAAQMKVGSVGAEDKPRFDKVVKQLQQVDGKAPAASAAVMRGRGGAPGGGTPPGPSGEGGKGGTGDGGDGDTLWAMRAASSALQIRWPEGESPRSWRGVTWSDDRVQGLDLEDSNLEVLPPQIGQLQALTKLNLRDSKLEVLAPEIGQLQALTTLWLTRCPLKELPPEIGQLRALTNLYLSYCPLLKELPPELGQLQALDRLDLDGCALKELPPEIGQLQALTTLWLTRCPLKELPPEFGQLLALANLGLEWCEQLTLAPGAKWPKQPVPTIVAAYARLLIVEPRKDAPGQLHAFLLAKPLAVPAFFKSILTDADHADWLGEAVKATPSLAELTDADDRRAIDVAGPAIAIWRRRMEEKARAEEEEERAEEERAAHACEEARLLNLIVDAPGQLYAFLLANPLAVPAFVKAIVTDPEHAARLGKAVKATPELAELTDANGLRAFAFAHLRCKQACEHFSNLRFL